MKKNLFKGISFTVGASLWWGIIGVIYFKFVSYASPLELTNMMVKIVKAATIPESLAREPEDKFTKVWAIIGQPPIP